MKMRAAILYEPNKPMPVEEVTVDDPQEHEVMVKLVATGICHSDLLPIKGDVPQASSCRCGTRRRRGRGEGRTWCDQRPARAIT